MLITHIQIRCPNCQHIGRVKSKYQGRVVSCKECGSPFRISSHVQFPCPNCKRELQIRAELFGRQVACKHCSHTFRARPEGNDLIALSFPWPTPESPAAKDGGEEPVSSVSPPEDEVQQLRAALADSTAEEAATGDQLREAPGRIADLKDQLQDLHDELEKAQEQNRQTETLRPDLAEDRSELDRVRDQARDLQKQVAELAPLRKELEVARTEAERLQVVIQEEQAATRQAAESRIGEIEALRVHHDRLQEELQRLRDEHESLRAEQNRLRDQAGALAEQADQVGPLREELEATRADAHRLRADLRGVQEQLAASQAELQAAKPPAEELDSLHAHRDRLQEEVQGLRAELEALRAEQDGSERALAEARQQHETSRCALARELEEAQSRWEAERRAMQDRWDQQQRDLSREIERRWAQEQVRAEADRQGWQEQLDEARREIDRQSALHQDERDRLSREADTYRREREQLIAACNDLKAARLLAEQRHQTGAAQLNQALAEAQRRAEALSRRNEELGGQVQRLQAEVHSQQQGREAERQDYERSLTALRHELATAHADLQRSSAVTGGSPEDDSSRPVSPPTSGPTLPAQHVGMYSDIALSDYNSEAFKRLLRDRRR